MTLKKPWKKIFLKNFFSSKKYLIIFWVLLLLAFLIGLLVWPAKNYYFKRQVSSIIEVLESSNENKNIDQCKLIMNFDKSEVSSKNPYFNETRFEKLYFDCDEEYNLKNVELTKDNCSFIIRETENYFNRNFIVYDSLALKRLDCSKKYLNPEFSNWTFFDINNDFKSQLFIDFELEFFRDIGEENSDEFINNRIEAKKRLIDLIQIEPKVEIPLDDVYLYSKRAILNLNLAPQTKYSISLLPYQTDMGELTEHKEFSFTTPENKYFWMKVKDALSLYTKKNLPEFEIIDYNTEKTSTEVAICNITASSYAEVEVYLKTANREVRDKFFKEWMKGIEISNCVSEKIVFKDESVKNTNEFVRYDFKFSDLVKEANPKWLYIAYFSNSSDVFYNKRVNRPILFWIVDSHIMMKVSRDWEWFFFVNDFEGNPLANQEIKVYSNDFREFGSDWNSDKRDYDITYNLWDDISVFSKPIVLWTTWDNWILKIDLKDKIEDYFWRTFEDSWYYNWSWLYKSFFVESSGEDSKSYLASTWNAWIEPWNFWYTTDWLNDDNIIRLDQWVEDNKYYAHIYPDRVLYLPWEEVNLKMVIRNAQDLSIPLDSEFKVFINNSKEEEVLTRTFKVSEYGSYALTLPLKADAPLWYYTVRLESNWKTIVYSGFNVEVFKNPKFYNEVSLSTTWLNWELVNITDKTIDNESYWEREIYKWSFKIKWSIFSKYYSGWVVANAPFTYKIYKQYYYDDSYWSDCYYWCYWEPSKEFYTEWTWKLDKNWIWTFEALVDFASSYDDYKYIVEVSVIDSAQDNITWSNSIIARLPEEYKKYNSSLDIYFETDSKFAKVWDNIKITGWLNVWDWTKDYNDKYIFAVKRKEYETEKVTDANWYTRNISRVNEIVEDVFLVNYDNFRLTKEWKLELDLKLDKNAEYVFEYGSVDSYYLNNYLALDEDKSFSEKDLKKIINLFDDNKSLYIENEVLEKKQIDICSDSQRSVKIIDKNCNNINDKEREEKCYQEVDSECLEEKEEKVTKKLNLRDLISWDKYFAVITYDNSSNASNPIINDNKLRVVSEKVSYKLWETAKVLIRLPVSDSKIMWTIEKNWVVHHEYIDVKWNVFFKEFVVDESFQPNAYIGVMMVDTSENVIPEYKVAYSEVVVDKTDRKSYINIVSDKKTYKPREEVTLNLDVKDINSKAVPSELTIMVVDDSLISLMWNVDLNTLEKMFIKLPFSIQTSITNIAMLKNYYFSRIWIVWGSGAGNNKWWDSAVSTRNIFKNTAYYNPSVITDSNWKATVKFTLPDNLTNFRVMVVANSKDNHFAYNEEFIEVRKNVVVEDKTPIILRAWDKAVIGANVFNNTDREIEFKLKASVSGADMLLKEQIIKLKWGEQQFVSWDLEVQKETKLIEYRIEALGDNLEDSDAVANSITIEEDPTLIRNLIKTWVVNPKQNLSLETLIPANTDLKNTKVELVFSNSRLSSIEKILKTLAQYPYWCIEQTVSSTLPNVIVKRFESMFAWIFDMEEVNKNIKDWVDRILSMQNSDWGFVYWQGNSTSDLYSTPYVLRSLIYMRDSGIEGLDDAINKAIIYLENNIKNAEDDTSSVEIYWALSMASKKPKITINDVSKLSRHNLIAYTYWLLLNNESDKIRENIETIKWKLISDNKEDWYWDNLSDKAIFASLLLDLEAEADFAYIEELIENLYSYDWSSYYYSTQSKNNAFMAFNKYLEKVWVNNTSSFSFKLWNLNDKKVYDLWGEFSNLLKLEYSLESVQLWEWLWLVIQNISDNKIYVDYIIKQYPEDKTKVEAYSNGMQVTREYYKVLDENLLDKCGDDYWYEENKIECAKAFEKKGDYKFVKWDLYKTRIVVSFPEESSRRLLTIEDYLPWAFRVINSRFRTESSLVRQASEDWQWSYKEFNPWVVMANAEYVWGKEMVLEYYFRPEFEWTFTLPPVTAYMMYNPLIRASGRYAIIEVE